MGDVGEPPDGPAETRPTRVDGVVDVDVGGSDTPIYRGRACTRCSRSKLRCIRKADPGVEPCVRCTRLEVECTLPEAKRRGPRKSQARRVGQLEQKLDGIMSLLTANQKLLHTQSDHSSTTTSQFGPTETSPASDGPLSSITYNPDPHQIGGSATGTGPGQQQRLPFPHFPPRNDMAKSTTPESPAQRTEQCSANPGEPSLDDVIHNDQQRFEVFPGFELSWRDARVVLSSYIKIYVPIFPFVPINERTPLKELFADSPFLLRTIMLTCAPQTAALQRVGDQWFRSYVAEQVVVLGKKTLEILQSILLFIAWGDYPFFMGSKVTPLLQIAIGMVLDLGLNRPALWFQNQTPYSLLTEAAKRLPHLSGKAAHSTDDMRAMLGCYYIASLLATLFRREHRLPYNEFMDRCCSELASADEFESDRILLAIVKMKTLVRRAHAILPGASPEPNSNAIFSAAASMGLASMRRELEDMSKNIKSEDDRINRLIRLHYHSCLMAIHEPALYMRSPLPTEVDTAAPSSIVTASGGGRTDALWRCLRAAVDFTDAFLELPLDLLGTQALFPTAHLAFCFVTSTRLLFLEDADWDGAAARRSFDFAVMARRMTDLYAAAAAIEDEAEGEDCGGRGGSVLSSSSSSSLPHRRRYHDLDSTTLLRTYVVKMRWLAQWYTARTAPPGSVVVWPEHPYSKQLGSASDPAERQQQQQQQQHRHQSQEDGHYQQPQQVTENTQQQVEQHPQEQQVTDEPGGAGSLRRMFDVEMTDPMTDFDLAVLQTFDDSFWSAFLSVDPQTGHLNNIYSE